MVTRELPPLRLHDEITTTSGKRYRWGPDEPNAADIPSGRRDSSTMPGGFETADGTLARKSGVDYSDLERLSTWRRLGVGGEVAWEGRLERAPRASGDQMAISPSAVGWQAHLDDDKSASMVYIDRDLGRWQGASRQRQVNLLSSGFNYQDSNVSNDATTGAPSVVTALEGQMDVASICEAWYDAGAGNRIAQLVGTWTRGGNISAADTNWGWIAAIEADDVASAGDVTAQLRATGPGNVNLQPATARRFAVLQLTRSTATAASTGGIQYAINWTGVAALGDHGLPRVADAAGLFGLLGSGVVAHAVGRWAPLLQVTADSVLPSSFVLTHLTFPELTTAAEIVRQATRFGLQDWAVWDDKTFYWHDRGARGRNWRARIGPAQLEETGPQIDRVWESVIVSYQDVDGTTRTVGPPGSGADTEDAVLHDSDPENPANRLGITRRDMLQMGVSTAAGATELGRRFLDEQKLLDTSGRATFTGYVQDDRGITYPYWKVRAGDTVTFVDAADTSARRIVRADNDHDGRTCTVDLDSPPEGLTALLERLSVVLVPLGF